MIPFLEVSEEVRDALKSKGPVVALESTIITHGMPYPENVETALRVEAAVRMNGAVPATTAIIKGKFKAGLTVDEITSLGKDGSSAVKASRRDLPLLLASGQMGSTTVAATLIIANMAAIKIMATGGIGGVHRGVSETHDISADLQEIATANVAVFSAGIKSILDIGRTLEYLETFGVPVIGFQTDEFPAFYTRSSGYGVDARVDSFEQIAEIMNIKWSASLKGVVLVACPIPEEDEPKAAFIQKAINVALADADRQKVTGKNITPFLLSRIEELTGGESLKANIKLVLNNASIAAGVAVAFSAKQ